jgi:hypothetical protein
MPGGAANRLQKDHFRVQLAFHPALAGFLSAAGQAAASRELSFAYLSI